MKQEHSYEQKIFNYWLSRAQRVVECSFGQLTKRFAVLQKAMEVTARKG
jgi:hypothetical protein